MSYLFEDGDMLNFPVECFVFTPESSRFPVRPHWHYYTEILFITEGKVGVSVGGEEHLLQNGDMIMFHPKTIHSVYSCDSSFFRYSGIKFDINRMNIAPGYSPKLRSIFRCAEKNRTNILFPYSLTAEMGVSEIFIKCLEEMNRHDYGYDIVLRSEISKLLVSIIRQWQKNGFRLDSEAYSEDSRYDIYSITEFIDRSINSNIKVSEIAEVCGMSYSYFAKKFLSVYGKTCKQYMDDMRIYKVEEYLAFTDFDLTRISQETGFSDCSHMIKSFKTRHGMTPKQFRNLRQNKNNA